MIRFSNGFLSSIRDRLPLSDIVGTRVTWDRKKTRPSKGDYWACCPFHGEKTPSFHVEDSKGRYHCFGCGASGDHFRFLMEIDGLSFPEAVERLAAEAGVAMPAPDPEFAQAQAKQRELGDVVELAAQFFESQLRAPAGRDALNYAERRGLNAAIRETFRIGFAPDSRHALIDFLAARGVPIADMNAAGLVILPDEPDRKPYDRFRGRLMITIEDARGKPVGFGGRVMGHGEPKYLNSPETELFRKREMLFNAQRARSAAHKAGRLIVVEGYMDAIALHRAGFEEAVASLGTAVGEEQISLMWRFADEPIVCFDGDKAGRSAAERMMDRAMPILRAGKSLRFLFLPAGLDPDDYLAERGSDAFEEHLRSALPLVDAVWEREIGARDLSTPERLAALQKELKRLAATIQDETIRGHYDQALRDRFFAMRRALRGQDSAGPRSGAPAALGKPFSRTPAPKLISPEEQLLSLAVQFPEHASKYSDLDVAELCEDPDIGEVLERILAGDTSAATLNQGSHRQLFPILQSDPSPRFVDRLFALLLCQMELRSVTAEASTDRAEVHDAMDDAAMERLLAVQSEAGRLRSKIAELESLLDEEASLMRAADPSV
ncbi:MAG: DNA primase [Pseudomonadota bacterium]